MKRTNTNTFKAVAYRYLIDCIQDDEAQGMTDRQKVKHINHRVRSELSHVVERQGFTQACRDFLSGLGIGIDFTYPAIVEAAEKMHGCKLTEQEADNVNDKWFDFMGYQLATLCRRVVIDEKDPIPVSK